MNRYNTRGWDRIRQTLRKTALCAAAPLVLALLAVAVAVAIAAGIAVATAVVVAVAPMLLLLAPVLILALPFVITALFAGSGGARPEHRRGASLRPPLVLVHAAPVDMIARPRETSSDRELDRTQGSALA